MKTKSIITAFVLIIIIHLQSQKKIENKNSFPILKGEYLGQKPPGIIPEIFAPGIISTELHDDAAPTFSPDNKEVYFRIVYKIKKKYFGTIFFMKQKNGIWSYPDIASFSGKFMDGGVKYSFNKKKLYLSSKRGRKEIISLYGMDLFEIRGVNGFWKKPERLSRLNSKNNEMYPSEAPDGTLYWLIEKKTNDPAPNVFRSRIKNNEWIKKERVDFFPDSKIITLDFSPDGNYILLTMRNTKNDIDMYVSFKQKNKWSKPINLGSKINSIFMDKCPAISPDGKFLFFVSNRFDKKKNPIKKWNNPIFNGYKKSSGADIYWVSAKIIDKRRQ